MWNVYIVRCKDGSLYTGITTDMKRRLEEHNGKGRPGARYTMAKRPVTLVYAETVRNRSEALSREAAIKRLSRVQKLHLIGDSH